MKILQQILDKAGLSPVSKFKVPSKSKPKEFHVVEMFADNHLECNCISGGYKQPCSHKKIIKAYLNKCQQTKNK